MNSKSKHYNSDITEEDIVAEMVEHDFVTKIPPKKKYKIQVLVRSIKKGEPRSIKDDSEKSDDLDDILTELDIIRKNLSSLVKKQWLYRYREKEIEKILLDMSERIQKCIDKLKYSDCTCMQFSDAEPPRKEDWDDYEISIPML